jgi:hypothetical protein
LIVLNLQLQWPTQDTARGIDLFDRKLSTPFLMLTQIGCSARLRATHA